MSSPKNKRKINLPIVISVVIVLMLTLVNLFGSSLKRRPNVLGAETKIENSDFWDNFLTQNPNYIPGWIEVGRLDKASQIDPNFFLK